MHTDRVGRLSRAISLLLARRSLARVLGLGTFTLPGLTDAKKHRKKHKNKKVKKNAFGCVNVGKFCKKASQCCSGICQGKKGKGKCKAHDTGGCQAEQNSCAGPASPCPDDPLSVCYRTTGNAAFCGSGLGPCEACVRDADCEAVAGVGAACVVCPDCPGIAATACIPATL